VSHTTPHSSVQLRMHVLVLSQVPGHAQVLQLSHTELFWLLQVPAIVSSAHVRLAGSHARL